jgi:hypothetical protein
MAGWVWLAVRKWRNGNYDVVAGKLKVAFGAVAQGVRPWRFDRALICGVIVMGYLSEKM